MLRAVLILLSLLCGATANGDVLDWFNGDKLTDGSRYAFVPSKAEPSIVAVDTLKRELAAVIEIPHIATAVLATSELDLLVATHAERQSATIVSLYNRKIVATLDLGMHPDVVLSNAYDRFVTFGSKDGTVSTWDLSGMTEVLRVSGLSNATLLTFSFDGSQLFVVEPALKQISVIDMSQQRVAHTIMLGGDEDPAAVVSALSRSADGYTGYVSVGSENRLVVIDLVKLKITDTLSVGRLPLRPYSTSDNRYVLVPNADDKSLTIYEPRAQHVAATIPVGIRPRDVNSGWLDTLAYVMPSEGNEIAVIDLQQLQLRSSISIPGRSDDGIVTSDSKTLVTAIIDSGQVAIIDTRERRLAALISTEAGSLDGVNIALSNNVCH